MAGVMEGVNSRTQLAGHNRLELLMFRLDGRQRFGINVFKVKEVIKCPPLTQIPYAHPAVRGIANMRGKTITLIDLGMAIGRPPLRELTDASVIITEYNRTIQGFLVGGVDHIVNLNWEEILPPPRGVGNNYMTAVTHIEDELVEIIDVEKVLSEIVHVVSTVSTQLIEEGQHGPERAPHHILVVDDSSVARNQVKRTLDQLGIESTLARDGSEGLAILKSWADEGVDVPSRLAMVICDVEMPKMDGYTMTAEIRHDPRLKGLYVILHSSLSGVFNNALTEKVGANQFIPKFNPDDLAQTVLQRIKEVDAGSVVS
jgi:two-component system chemotaxis response regulator CheV